MKISSRDIELLRDLEAANYASEYPQPWATPLELGARNGSYHSGALAKLAKYGLVQFKQRGGKDPEDGQNGKSARSLGWSRGSKCYRITPAGREFLKSNSAR